MKTKIILATLLCVGVLYAKDAIIQASELPAKAQDFIAKHFQGSNATLVKKDLDSFEVNLNDGTEIEFMANGDWKDVDGKYKAIPLGFLPDELVSKAKTTQANAQIVKVEKEVSGYKFEFNNNMKVYVDQNGNVLGQKMDD